MAVTSLQVVGFKVHGNTRLVLDGLTCLVGPNGVGKSSVLEALEAMLRLPQAPWQVDSLGRYHPLMTGRRVDETLSVKLSGWATPPSLLSRNPYSKPEEEQPWHLTFEVEGSMLSPQCQVQWQHGDGTDTISGGPRHGLIRTLLPRMQAVPIDSGILLRLEPQAIARPVPVVIEEKTPVLQANGLGLPAVLAYLKLFDEGRFRQIVEDLRRIVPVVEDLRLNQAQWSELRREEYDSEEYRANITGAELRFDVVGAKNIAGQAVSEGTLLTLAILTAIHLAVPPRIIMLDDLERGLHPKAQRILIDVIRKILSSQPDLKMVLTTHSPYLVDEFSPDEVVVMAQRPDGITQARRLSTHPDAERAQGVLSTGEFLAAEEEDWVLEEQNG